MDLHHDAQVVWAAMGNALQAARCLFDGRAEGDDLVDGADHGAISESVPRQRAAARMMARSCTSNVWR